MEEEFYDPGRDRQIGAVIHFPASSTGSSEFAEGAFPVLIFGHGFLMSVDAYENFRDRSVPDGYILVLPTTEGGFPDHQAFGEDLAFLAGALQAAGSDAASIFNGHVAPATALMGHSMGGGASMLAGAMDPPVQTIVNFAAAETDPSAIAAAGQITLPTLMFAASEDCVTPIGAHQQPMFNALSSNCKALVNINGGGHCYFANSNLTCELGEFTCFPDLSIDRAAQHDVVFDFLDPWLKAFLLNDEAAFSTFLDSASTSDRAVILQDCIPTAVDREEKPEVNVHPVPADKELHIAIGARIDEILLVDPLGRIVYAGSPKDGKLDVSAIPNGGYQMLIRSKGGRYSKRIIVLH